MGGQAAGGSGRRAALLGGAVVLAAALLVVLLVVRGGDGGSSAPVPAATPAATAGVVTRVVDGDTLDVAGVGRVRVIGIDTPEAGECGHDEASAELAALVLGERVTLTPGAQDDVDRYGRLLRYVDVGGTDAGLALVRDGRAQARYDSRDGYGTHPREEEYVRADAAAPDACTGAR